MTRWQLQAACADADPELFFAPDQREKVAQRNARHEKAKSFCRQCPVRVRCAEQGDARTVPYGIWGGLTERERTELLAATPAPAKPKPERLPPTPGEHCGSMRGYRWHHARNQEACRRCKDAKAADSRAERNGTTDRPAAPAPVRAVTHQEEVAA